jgi:hypothetical protein
MFCLQLFVKSRFCALLWEAAYALAHKIHFLKGEITVLGFESFMQQSLGNLPRSMELAVEALQLTKDKHLEKYSGPALNAAAGVISH